MYPLLESDESFRRVKVDSDLTSFHAGTQARAFRELALGAGAVLHIMMIRPVDIIIRRFSLYVNAGEIRCDIYRGATSSGSWSEAIPVIPKNEIATRPTPFYVPKSQILVGGTFTGGTIYDIIDVKTAGAGGLQSSIGNTSEDILGAPAGIGWYKFSNPGSVMASGLFSICAY
jgi:hypothetical protein